MHFLITGFEPFGGSQINPSEQVARKLAGQVLDRSVIHTQILPVDRVLGPAKLLDALTAHPPDAVLCLGEASGRPGISLERVAINLLDFRIPDNSGNQVVDLPVVPGGPAAYLSTFPLRQMVESINNAGIPVEISLSAGTFLCNQIFYHLMHFLAAHERNIPAGFIHLPALPEQMAQQSKFGPSMNLDLLLVAIKAAVACIAQPPTGS
jgi:pyroglutamyl-peptidase